jgi:hypothetical protein
MTGAYDLQMTHSIQNCLMACGDMTERGNIERELCCSRSGEGGCGRARETTRGKDGLSGGGSCTERAVIPATQGICGIWWVVKFKSMRNSFQWAWCWFSRHFSEK